MQRAACQSDRVLGLGRDGRGPEISKELALVFEVPMVVMALMTGALVLMLFLAVLVGFRVLRRRRAVRVAKRDDTPLRRAARERQAHLVENRVMRWVPDDHSGGWHLVGSYLPSTNQEPAPVNSPRWRRRGR